MGTICNSGACLLKTGVNVSSDFTGAEANTNWEQLINQATSQVTAVSRKDWSGAWVSISDDKKQIIVDVVSNLAAVYAISYDMSGYTTILEVEDMINVLTFKSNQILKLLADQKVVGFIT